MADGRHVRKCWKCYNSPTNRPTWTKLGWSHPIVSPIHPPWCGCHGNGRYLATAHWTFSSYGDLEAERVNQFWQNLVYNRKLRPQWQSRDQILIFFLNSTWRTAAMLENVGNAITRLPIDLIGLNLGGRIPSCFRYVRYDAVAMATALWTFCSYGRLEAKRVIQFCWNLVNNSKLGPQWRSHDQILKFLKNSKCRTVVVGKYSKCHNSPANVPTGTQLGWPHPIMFPILEML